LQVVAGDFQLDATQRDSDLEEVAGGQFSLQPAADSGLVESASNDRRFDD
jgi:hypothetical protein